jgi:hypothetical protein
VAACIIGGVGRGTRREEMRREARLVGALGFAGAVALPAILFHRVVGTVVFRPEARYLTGWIPWVLMAAGLLFLLPVAISAGRDPASPLYPRARRAYAGWGVTLYLLGFALATQVSTLVEGPGMH